jgi:small subunit ribosomal protein S1
MAATYDEQGNYIYPEGFDPETGEWLEGFEKQREEWERQYAEAQARFEAHRLLSWLPPMSRRVSSG